MNETNRVPRSAKIIRWTARIWSLLILVLILMIFIGPTLFPAPDLDEGGGTPIALLDVFLLSLFSLATLGLLLAWRWELAGAVLTIASVIVQQLTFSIANKMWDDGQLIQASLFVIPAILFLIAWGLAKQAKRRVEGSHE